MERMKPIVFREAQEADAALVLQFIRELADFEGLLHEVVASEDLIREWVFQKKGAQVLLGEVEGEPVGFALYFRNFSTFLGRSGLYLEDLFVREAFRGRGYGKAFLRKLAQIAVAEGCGRLEWWCLDENTSSVAFYRALSAEPMSDWTVFRLAGDSLQRMAEPEPETT